MTFAQIKRLYGPTDSEIARNLGVSRQLVAHWRVNGLSPARQGWLQLQTGGKLKADHARSPR